MSQRAKVVVADFITEPLDHEGRILGDIAEIVALNAFSENDLIGRIEDADAIMLYHFIGISAGTTCASKAARTAGVCCWARRPTTW